MALGLSAVALLATACTAGTGPNPAPTGTVTGTLVVTPCRPVERAGDPPCPPRPGVGVRFQPDAGGRAITALTDGLGSYRVDLPAGSYRVRVEGGMAPGPATTVTVRARSVTRLDLTADSGMR